ncbi:MAG: CsbD family protein [Planctomycetota bacterium]|nr:CsbD family protein [Planctomycetota bacterium]
MNWDTIEGQWKDMKGRVREQWGRLTDDEIDQIAGRRERLEGAVQRAYGKTRDEVQREVDDWARDCNCP